MSRPCHIGRRTALWWLLLALLPYVSHRTAAQVARTSTLTFNSIADSYVDSGSPKSNFNSSAQLRTGSSPTRIIYLRFAVTGVNGRRVQQARLRLGVNAGGPSGGTVHAISNGTWNEATVSYTTHPAVDGPGLQTLGTVKTRATVEFTVDAVITGDGIYNVAIDSTNKTAVSYNSALAKSGQKPQLVLTVAAQAPTVTIAQPPDGASFFVGDRITLQGSAQDGAGVDLSSQLSWTSNLAGPLGVGAVVSTALGQGAHTITAAVTNGQGLTGSSHITLTVSAPPPADTEPLVTITAPMSGATLASGVPITLTGSADDLEDGDLTARLAWASSLDGPLGTGGSFSHALSEGTHQITATVTDSGGLRGTAVVTVVVQTGVALEFPTSADASVDAGLPTTNFGVSRILAVDANTARISYLRFAVSGLASRTILGAVLRLQVDTAPGADSDSGGVLHTITNGTWQESTITFNARPAVDGPVVASQGAVQLGQTVDLDVHTAVTGDGTYNFAIVSSSADECDYRSRESGPAPTLVVTLAASRPTVTIAAPADGGTFFQHDSITLTGRATDSLDGDLSSRLQWTSSRDGAVGTGAAISTSSLSVGTHTITAAVTNQDGLRGEASVGLRVRSPNRPPQVTIGAPADGASVPAGTSLTLAAAASDDFDGTLTSKLQWTSSRDGILGTGGVRTVTLSEGAHVLTASVTDSDGATGSAQVHVTVTPTPPAVTIAGPPDGTTVFAGTSLTFSGTAVDATDGNLTASVRWTSDRDGLLGTGASISTSRLSAATHTITAAATDRGGLTGQAQRTVVVRLPNRPPVVVILAPAAGTTLLAGKLAVLGATALDPENGDLGGSIRWTSSRDGALGTGPTVIWPSLSAGTHTLTATVTDLDGATGSASVAVNVVPATVTFTPVADTYVDSGAATKALGTATTMLASSSPVRQAFLRFQVTGVGSLKVQQALVRLTVGPNSSDASAVGGTLRTISNNTWSEKTTNYNTRPVVDGSLLATKAKVLAKQVVDFDATAAVTGDGTYNFAVVSSSTDWVTYLARESAAGKPQLMLTLTQNTAPVVNVTAPLPNAVVDADTPVTFTGTAVDAESGNLSSQIQWTSSLDGALGTGASLTVARLQPGTHTITAAATDGGGKTGRASITILVDVPPAVAITAPANGATLDPGAPITFVATANDAEDGSLASRVTWTSSRDGVLGTGASITRTLSTGTHTITASATDSAGKAGSASVIVTVDAAPTVAITAPASGSTYEPGTAVALTAAASDAEDGDLASRITWTSSHDGALGTGSGITTRTLSAGTHTIRASVSDSVGRTSTAQVTVRVNATPRITITAPAPGTSPEPHTAVTFSATALDPEDGNLSSGITWTSSRDGALGTGASIATSGLSTGSHTITAAVTDSGGKQASATLTVVINATPTARILAPADGARSDRVPVTFTGTASDPEDGDVSATLDWSSDRDGHLGTGSTIVAPSLTSGTHVITASVTDARGKRGTASITVVVNATPTVTITAPTTGSSFEHGAPITFAATASDPEDGNLTGSIVWSSNRDGAIGSGSSITLATLSSGTHTITASATDAGGKTGSASITIVVNSTPEVTIAPLGASSFEAGQAIDLAATATDLEDHDLTAAIVWKADGSVTLGSGGSVSVSTLASGLHTITASATDSGGKTGQAWVNVTVNATPQVTITAPVAHDFEPQTAIGFAASATDTEDGNLTARIVWTEGTTVLGTGGSLSLSTLTSGQHAVTASASDSGNRTGRASVIVTINATPALLVSSPADHDTFEPGATITLVGTAGDLEDGPLTSQIWWTVDGSTALGTGGRVSTSTLASGSHTITAAVSDSGGKAARTWITIAVNATPTVTITAPLDGAVYEPGVAIGFAATATDTEDGSLTSAIRWTADGETPLGTGGRIWVSTLASGSHTITVSATDSGNKTGNASITVVVNAIPAVHVTASARNAQPYDPHEAVTLAATATDPEDGDLGSAITWQSDRDGTIGMGPSITVTSLTTGTHHITASATDSGGKIDQDSITILVDAAPTVAMTTPTGGATYEPGEPIIFTAMVTDAEDGNLTPSTTWTSSLDGALGTGASITTSTLRAGTHVITAAATDSAGNTGRATLTVAVDATPTVAIIAPASGSTFDPEEVITFTRTASDVEDGDLSAAIAWTSSRDGALGTGGGVSVSTLGTGTHTITASVTDAAGKTASRAITITVDASPTVTIVSPTSGSTFEPGAAIVFSATASDAEEGSLTPAIAWTSSRDGALGTGGSITVSTLTAGTQTITASVTDAAGKATSTAITVTVDARSTIAITTPASGSTFEPGAAITFAATLADAEDGSEAAGIAWTSSRDGTLGTGGSVTVSTLTAGIHTITASVTDAAGKTASRAITITIDASPTVTILSPTSGATFEPRAAITFTARASDAEEGSLTPAIAWTSSRDGALGTGGGVTVGTLTTGTHTITAAVTDAAGRMGSQAITIVVDDTPAVTITAPAPGSRVKSGAAITFTATAADGEDGDLGAGVRWTSSRDGALGTGSSITASTLSAGTHVITAAAADSAGKTGSASITVTVDARPRVTIASPADGSTFAAGRPIVFVGSANDAEDGDLTASLAWTSSLDGPLGSGPTLAVTTLRPGTHTVTAVVTDSGGNQGAGAITVIVNAPPTVAITAPADGSTYVPGDTVRLQATASDLEDGDLSQAIIWTSSLDGGLGSGGTLSVRTLRSGVHTLRATVTDSGGEIASAQVTVVINAPPAITITAPVSGSVVSAGDAVALGAAASDAEDGDLGAAVVWSSDLDGLLGSGSALVVRTLRSGTHRISASVADSGGKTASAAITLVVNAAPTVAITAPAEGAVFSPGDTVSLTGTASDREDGDLGALIVWTSSRDGLLGAGATLPVATLRSGTHVVTASVTDSGGKSAVAAVTIVVDAAPTVAVTAPASGSIFAPDEPVGLTASASDAEDGDLSGAIAWTSSLDGPLGTGGDLHVGPLRSGAHVLTASVTDSAGRSASATTTIVVAPLITLNGTFSKSYTKSLAPKTKIDARGATFFASPTNLYPISLDGGDGVRVVGGAVFGQYDRNLTWDQMHSMNNAGIAFDNNLFTVDGIRIDNVEDGIRPRKGGGFTVRNVHVSYVRDDCIENDHLNDGLVDDSLFDGCYDAFSARPSQAIIDSGFDGSNKLWTIQNSLVRLQPMPGPDGGSSDGLGNAGFFKWHKWDNPTSLSPKLALYNNVFMAERVGQPGASRMGIPPGQLRGCANNVMVWLGPGDFPTALPDCFAVTKDRAVWDAAVAGWLARHPGVVN